MNQADAIQAGSEVLDLEQRGWLPRHCRGDSQAFAQLMRQYRALIYTFLYRYGIDEQNRDDLYQEIFLKVHQAAHRYRPSQPLGPWLVTIALNTMRNHRRNQARRWRIVKQLPQQVEQHAPGVDETVEQRQSLDWLETAITELPEPQREVLVLSTLKGLRMKDIASMMKFSENTIKTHLRRARLTLAEALAARDKPAAGKGVLE